MLLITNNCLNATIWTSQSKHISLQSFDQNIWSVEVLFHIYPERVHWGKFIDYGYLSNSFINTKPSLAAASPVYLKSF